MVNLCDSNKTNLILIALKKFMFGKKKIKMRKTINKVISNKKYYFWTFILYRYPHWHIMPYKTLNQIKIGPQIYQITNKISKMKDQAFITERPFKCEGYFIHIFSRVMSWSMFTTASSIKL